MNLKVNTSQKPAHNAAEKLGRLLHDTEPNSVLLMLSGGSAFQLLEHLDPSKSFAHVTISMLDERYSTEKAINNFARLTETEFYVKARTGAASFLDTRIQDGESFNEAEVRFDYAVKSWIHDNPGGKIIVTMGIGEDGHTAGIFPHENDEKFRFLFEQDEHFVVGYHASTSTYPERMTVTDHFLREYADAAVIFATGEAKRTALQRVLAGEGNLYETPARIVREMKNAELFTDMEISTGL
jgi:6-phosphogluconolactonase/glucosamine-6-phosphate isomerase/deaminase